MLTIKTQLVITVKPRVGFLDLPLTVRRMIYERIPKKVRFVPVMRGPANGEEKWADKPVAMLVQRFVPRTILQVCRQICKEAERVLDIETMKLGPPQFIVLSDYISHIPSFVKMLAAHNNDAHSPPLRFTDDDREKLHEMLHEEICEDEDTAIAMWSRLATLSLQCYKHIEIAIYIDFADVPPNFAILLQRIIRELSFIRWGYGNDPTYNFTLESANGDNLGLNRTAMIVGKQILEQEGAEAEWDIEWCQRLNNWGLMSFQLLFNVPEKAWKHLNP